MKIDLININKSFINKHTKHIKYVLDDLSFTFTNGFYVLKGDNGVGKTTLFYILGLLDKDYSGDYLINDKNVKTLLAHDKKYLSSKISMLFSKSNLLPFLTVEETRKKFADNHNTSINFNLELPDNQLVGTLSGGEEILLALEIDLSIDKKIFLLDEVTAMLDNDHFISLMNILDSISKDAIVILISHDHRSFKYGNLLELKNGKICSCS